jgi:hypothetical protein
MNLKQLVILLALGVAFGTLGLFMSKQKSAAFKPTEGTLGKKLLGDFKVNDVAQLTIKHHTNELNLVKQEGTWKVKERYNYPASFTEIRELINKLADLKVVQSPKVGASQFARLELLAPGAGQGTNSGTLVEFKGESGNVVKSLLLGKKVTRESGEENPMFGGGGGGGGGYPVGRYVLVTGGSQSVALVSDALSNVEPKPDQWLDKDFFKVEKLKSIAVVSANPSNTWQVARTNETGTFSLVDKKENEDIDASKLSSVSYALSSPSFNDVLSPETKPETLGLDKPIVATLTTFDDFTYTVKIGTKTSDDKFPIAVVVAAELPAERTAGKDEKPEDKEKLDKEFKEKADKFKEKLTKEKGCEKWTYLVDKWTIDSLLKERKDFFAEKKTDTKTGPKPGDKTETNPDEKADEKSDDDKEENGDGPLIPPQ